MKIWQSKIDLFDSLNIKRWLIIWDGDSNKYKATKKVILVLIMMIKICIFYAYDIYIDYYFNARLHNIIFSLLFCSTKFQVTPYLLIIKVFLKLMELEIYIRNSNIYIFKTIWCIVDKHLNMMILA